MQTDVSLWEEYRRCQLCPRHCGTDRTKQTGVCGEDARLSIETALLHRGEEPCISSERGSGTIFFTGCSLHCIFCQNREISQRLPNREKRYYSLEGLVEMMEKLLKLGAANINFVTPDHYLPHILAAAKEIRRRGYCQPFVYNCSGYQSLSSLERAVQWMDIFLIDYKFSLQEAAQQCVSLTEKANYPEIASKAIEYLYRSKGNLQLDEAGTAKQGVLIRHLVLPGEEFLANSRDVLNELFFRFGTEPYLSLMSQYTPAFLSREHPDLNRFLSPAEYQQIVSFAEQLGFTHLYTQEIPSGKDKYIPDFSHKEMYGSW